MALTLRSRTELIRRRENKSFELYLPDEPSSLHDYRAVGKGSNSNVWIPILRVG